MRVIAPLPAVAHSRGMTLIELMIGMAIAAILFLLAAPAYQEFIANTNVRSAAENTLNGLRTANAEAIKRNAPVRFAIVDGGWKVDEVNPADGTVVDPITTYAYTEGAKNAKVDSFGGGTTVTFNGLGRVMNPNPGDFPLITDLQFSTAMIDNERKQHIVVGNALSATGIRMCNNNTNLPADDPGRCPDVTDHQDRGT